MDITTALRKLTIRTRMYGSVVVTVLLIALVGGSGIWGMFRIQNSGTLFIEGPFMNSVHLGSLNRHFGDARKEEKSMIILFKQDLKERREAWDNAMAGVQTDIKELKKSTAENESLGLIKSLEDEIEKYKKNFESKINNFAFYSDSRAVEQDLAYMQRAAEDAQRLIGELRINLEKDSGDARAKIVSSEKETLVIFGCVLTISILFVVAFTLVNLNSILNPIVEAKRISTAIASGSLNVQIGIEGMDECAELMRSLQEMQASLSSTVQGVRNSAESISIASNEVAGGSQDLSQRTERSAASIQDSSNELQQVTETVQKSTETALKASELAGFASNIAQQGRQVVSRVVETMAEIHGSSKHIADITNLIDAISFQTNILALNAAVEAARAGDQGRGFAVVASEVRALAKRSAQAAQEIRQLIESSVEKIELGSQLGNQAGSTMTEIVSSIGNASDMIGEVSASSIEQSTRLASVNDAVSQLEGMTQQNAALVEQSAAASDSLKEQALKLNQLMQYFQLDQSGYTKQHLQLSQ